MKNILLLLLLLPFYSIAQVSPIDFEPNGHGATWNWTVFENDNNAALQIISNPSATGINTSTKVAAITTKILGAPWAGFESQHGSDIGTFTLDSNNAVIKIMVYKPVISDVGIKLVLPSNASFGEIKVPNTLINQWEELTFDFRPFIGLPTAIGIDQIVVFPDFQTRTTNNLCYLDNIRFGNFVAPPSINVTFSVQHPDSSPVYVFGNWNNWSNYPGTPMTEVPLGSGTYIATINLPGNSTIEYLFVEGLGPTKETLDSSWSCTNHNPIYTNRLAALSTSDTTLCNIWKTCNTCIIASTFNPTTQNLKLEFNTQTLQLISPENTIIDFINIYDISGRKIMATSSQNITNTAIPVNLNPNTMYIFQIQIGQKIHTFKGQIM